ncbi:MAG: helix-turn-helix domain-containing protein [Chloroflexota bacterium]|nr:helix-turn-helix domain-containing protein [Chloroflexota bacterium]
MQEALRGHGMLRFYERPADLAAAVGAGGVTAVLIEPRDGRGYSTAQLVESLRTGFPGVAVIAYCDHRHDSSGDILALARAGVNELAFRGTDDVRLALTAALTSAEHQSTAELVLRELAPAVPASVRPLVAYCLEHAGTRLSVARVAAEFGVHRKTLVNRLDQAGLPTPIALIGWCRLLVAARLLDDPGRSVEQVALSLDFPSGTALRNMLKRYTGLNAREVRENGGLRCLIRMFQQTLARPRAEPVPKTIGARSRTHSAVRNRAR